MGDTRGASEDARPERDAAYHTVVAWPGKDKRKLRWKKVYVRELETEIYIFGHGCWR
jgi:hypothetical protein